MKWLTAFAGSMLLFVSVANSFAQTSNIQGAFALDPRKSDDVGQIIDSAVSDMNVFVRSIARYRLRKMNVEYPHLFFEHPPNQIAVAIDSRPPIRTPDDGEPVKWTRDDGEVLVVSTKLNDRTLEQIFAAKDGNRVNLFELSPDGQELTMHVTLNTYHLKGPLSYKLVYRRM